MTRLTVAQKAENIKLKAYRTAAQDYNQSKDGLRAVAARHGISWQPFRRWLIEQGIPLHPSPDHEWRDQ